MFNRWSNVATSVLVLLFCHAAIAHSDSAKVNSLDFGEQDAATINRRFRGVVQREYAGSPRLKEIQFSVPGNSGSANVVRLIPAFSLTGHTGAVLALAFSNDGQFLASGGHDDAVRVWNMQTQKPVRTFKGDAQAVTAVAFGPAAKRLVTASGDGTIRLWSLETGQLIRSVQVTGEVSSLALGPKSIIAGMKKGKIALLSPRAKPKYINAHDTEVSSITWAQNGSTLVSRARDGVLYCWRVGPRGLRPVEPPPKLMAKLVQTSSVSKGAIAFSRDHKVVARPDEPGFGGENGAVIVKATTPDAQARTLIVPRGADGEMNSLIFSPGRKWLAGGGADGRIHLWDISGLLASTATGTETPHTTGQPQTVPDNDGDEWWAGDGAEPTEEAGTAPQAKQPPGYRRELQGSIDVRVNNPGETWASVGFRLGRDGVLYRYGTDFLVRPGGAEIVSVPNGTYDVYVEFADQPQRLLKCNPLTVNNKPLEVTLEVVNGGNLGFEEVP